MSNAYTGIRGAVSAGVQDSIKLQETDLRQRQEERLNEEQRVKQLANQAENVLKFNYSPRAQDITNKYHLKKMTLEEANASLRDLSEEIYNQNPWLNEVIPGGQIYQSISPEGLTEITQRISGDRAKAQNLDPSKNWIIKKRMFENQQVGNTEITEDYISSKEQADIAVDYARLAAETQKSLMSIYNKDKGFSPSDITTLAVKEYTENMGKYKDVMEAVTFVVNAANSIRKNGGAQLQNNEPQSEESTGKTFIDPTDGNAYPIVIQNGKEYFSTNKGLFLLDKFKNKGQISDKEIANKTLLKSVFGGIRSEEKSAFEEIGAAKERANTSAANGNRNYNKKKNIDLNLNYENLTPNMNTR